MGDQTHQISVREGKEVALRMKVQLEMVAHGCHSSLEDKWDWWVPLDRRRRPDGRSDLHCHRGNDSKGNGVGDGKGDREALPTGVPMQFLSLAVRAKQGGWQRSPRREQRNNRVAENVTCICYNRDPNGVTHCNILLSKKNEENMAINTTINILR
jgi:hypothetical protein